ncbi:hypothetical protein [Oceanobacillus sp. 1P07AA]
MKRIGIGKSYGKVILMGEYAAVFGYPSIAVPTPNQHLQVLTSVELQKSK